MKKTILTVLLVAAYMLGHAQDPKKKDEKFAMAAAKGGLLEVKLGELAQSNGSSQEIKLLGQMMQEDHSKANAELKTLALSKGILLPNSLDPEGQKKYDELAKMKGEEFDKAYSKFMVKDHKKDIKMFKKEANSGSDSQMKEWASKTLPKLEHHLEMSKQACDKTKK
jgi:putative membrane protein